jgi:hypothetical protein
LLDTNSNNEDLSTSCGFADFGRSPACWIHRRRHQSALQRVNRSVRSQSRSQLPKRLEGRSSSIAASLTMAATTTTPPIQVANFAHLAESEPNPKRVPAGFAIGADRQGTDGGNEPRAHREEKEAEAELDHPEEREQCAGREFLRAGWPRPRRFSNGASNAARD